VGKAHIGKHTSNFLCARRTGFSHETELPRCPGYGTLALRFTLRKKGGAPNLRSPFPLLAVIKAQPLREGIVYLG
jgi:hypothetical protein